MIKSISVTNFMNISSASLDFKSGINAILGTTGSGKSSILEAITYCLLERTRGDSWKDFVKTGTDGFHIDLVVSAPDGKDVIFDYTSSLKANKVDKKLYYDKPEAYEGEDANNAVKRIFDTDILRNIVFNMQDRSTLSKIRPGDSRALFNKVFNSDFPDPIEKIKSDKDAISSDLMKIQATLDNLRSKRYNFFRIADIDQSELIKLQDELSKSQASEVEKQRFMLYSEKVLALSNIQQKLMALNSQVLNENKLYASLHEYLKEIEASKETNNKLLAQVTEQHDSKQMELNKCQIDYDSFKSPDLQTKTQELIEHHRKLLIEADSEIKLYQKQIDTSLKGICPECGNVCTTQHVAELEEKKSKAVSLKEIASNDYAKAQETLNSYLKALQDYKDRISSLTLEVTKLDNELTRQRQILKSADDLAVARKDQIAQKASYIDSINAEIVKLESDLLALQNWLNGNKPVELDSSIRSVNEIQKEINSMIAAVAEATQQERINEQLRIEQENDSKQIVLLQAQADEKSAFLIDLENAKKGLEIDFPAFINKKSCMLLQDYMNNFFLNTKGDFRTMIDVNKKGIIFKYKARNEPNWIPISMASGFESAMITLGFNCSIAMAYGCPLVVLDEPDKDADDKSSERLMETIIGLDLFKQIIIISHNPACQDVLLNNDTNLYHVDNGVFELVS